MSENEIKYTIRLILGSLRIGGSKSTSLDALSECLIENYHHNKRWYDVEMPKQFGMSKSSFKPQEIINQFESMTTSEKIELLSKRKAYSELKIKDIPKAMTKNWTKLIKKMFSEFPDPEKIINTFLLFGNLDICKNICKMRPGIPCSPMLAKPTKSAAEALKKLKGNLFTCELKYDGLRGQAHIFKKNGALTVQIFSRNLENLTPKYPVLVQALLDMAAKNNLSSVILDGEVMASDPASGKILPFQILMKKKNSTHQICYYAFDMLYKNEENLMGKSFKDRREDLHSLSTEGVSSNLKIASGWDISSKKDIMIYLHKAVAMGGEGLMIKSLGKNSEYIPSNRSAQWLKLKKDYIETGGLGDSFDLVVMGAISGEGKRKGLFGSFLVGAYNEESDGFETCCMVGTGFTDVLLKSLHKRLSKKVSSRLFNV